MNLTQCPYDGAQVGTEMTPPGVLRLTCAACGAAWERTDGRTERVGEPDPQRLRSARRHGVPMAASEPLPMAARVDVGSDLAQ